ncbi:MAG TPA: ABC transporter permease, partial [Burkholderiales bacterium]|nr:ABC transporter permease [Burkholderiales bacterium]
YQEKGLEFFLALSMGRTRYFFGKLLGYASCSLLLAMLFSMPFFLSNSPSAVSIWGISLFLELLLMSAVSLFFSISLTQMPLALAAVSGFYLLSRSMGTIVLIMKGPLANHGLLQGVADRMISLIACLLPTLDDFTRTAWLVYPEPKWQVLLPVFSQTAIYLLLMCAAALYDFHRREI